MEPNRREKLALIIAVFGFVAILAMFAAWFNDRYMLVSAVLVVLCLAPFYLRFERKKTSAKELVLIAVLVALASIGRIPFAWIPSVQPSTFIIMMTGLVFGAEAGFLVGAMTALCTNLFLGQGPWTPWQMFSWGMVGCSAGWLNHWWWMRKRWGQIIFGFVWGLLFGWLTNLVTVVSLFSVFSWQLLLSIYAASLAFDLLHAVCNVILIWLFAASWVKILQRFKRKYGLA